MRLLTWNIQWGRGADGRVDLDRIVAHARQLADFDVLCLQEVSDGYEELGGNDGSDQFAGLAQRLPGFTPVIGVATDTPHPSGRRRRFGNMILTRLPLGPVWRHLLPWPADESPTLSMQRVAIEATVATPIGPVRVTTTHLEYYSARQRMAQVEQLRQLHREAVGHARHPRPGGSADGPFDAVARGGPAILAGDFNFQPTDAEHTRLMSPIDDATPPYRDAWTLLHGEARHPATVGVHDKVLWPGPTFSWDFVFVNADLAPRLRAVSVDASSDASDHQPVLVELDTGGTG